MPEECNAAEELEIGVHYQTGEELPVREIKRVIQDHQSGHQLCRQVRHAWPVVADLTAAGLDGLHRNGIRQLIVHVDDLVES